MGAFIPAPWHQDGEHVFFDSPISGAVMVATVHNDGTWLADAKLIAAAPELLAALVDIVAAVRGDWPIGAQLDAADAAIAKAKGGVQ